MIKGDKQENETSWFKGGAWAEQDETESRDTPSCSLVNTDKESRKDYLSCEKFVFCKQV